MKETSFKRWLLASLALNVFLAGGIAGGAWHWWTAERAAKAGTAQPRGLRFAADGLSAEQSRAFRLRLRDARREVDASIQSARDGRHELMRLLSAPQFDRAAVTATVERVRDADRTARIRLEDSVIEFASTLAPEDRQKLAEGLARSGAPRAGLTRAKP